MELKKKVIKIKKGCNEHFRGRYWCPKAQWFSAEPCPFTSPEECREFNKWVAKK